MSNVLNFDVYKNTLKRRDGFSPVGGEFAYSKIICHFQEGDDWDGVHIVTAGFFVNTKHVVAVNAAIDNDNALTVSIPAQLLKKHEQIKFGLLGSVTADDEVVMTIATNVVSIDVARGIVSDALDEEAAEPGLYDRLLAALNEGLQNNIDYVDSQNAAQNLAIEGKASKVGIGSSDELISSANSGDIKRSGYLVTNNSNAIKNTESTAILIPTARAVGEVVDGIRNQIENKADKSEIPDISGKADKTYVDSQNTAQNAVIAKKANTDDVYSKAAAIGLFQLLAYKTDQLLNPELLNPTSYPSAKAVINLVAQKTVNTFDGENDEVLKYMSKEPQTDLDYVYSNVNTSLSERKDIPGAFSVVLPTFTHCVRIVDCQTGEEWKETAAEGTYEIRNLIPGRIYRYYVLKSDGAVLKSGSCTARGQVRMIDIPTLNGTRNVFNIRDLGGWACDGGVMKYGLVFRGGRLNGSNPSVSNSNIVLESGQISYLRNVLHIADEIDLRTSNEISRDSINGSALGEDVGWINKTLGYYQYSLTDSTSENYAVLINRLAQNLAEGKTTYIHCNSGADRSAQLCMFIEAICGVSQVDMERDYELTSYAFEYKSGQIDRRRNMATNACWKLLVQALQSETGNTIQEKAVNFLIRKGVTAYSVSVIREKLIERSGTFDGMRFVNVPTGGSVDDCTEKNTVYKVWFSSGVVANSTSHVICVHSENKLMQYAFTRSGFILFRGLAAGGEWTAWDYIPTRGNVAEMINALTIPTKTSQLINDSGFLTQHQDISGKFDKSKIVKRATEAQVGLAQDTVFSTQAADDYLQYFLNQYYTALQVSNKIEEWFDGVLSNDSGYDQKLLIDNTVDQAYNPNGHYILYYIDSDGGRHNIFDFSNYFAEKAAVPTKTSQLTNDSGFLTSHQSLANYYNKTDVNNLLAGKANASHTHSQYLTSADIADKADKSELPTKTSQLTNDSSFITAAAIANKVDKEAGKGLSANDFTDSDKKLLEAGCVETKNRFNLKTDIILGKNGTGDSSAIRAVTVALNTGGGQSVVSVKNLPSNLKYQVWGYSDENFSSPTNYTLNWIVQRGQSTVVAKPYVRVLFGTVNNAAITAADFEELELQVEEGEQKTDYTPKYTAFDYVARNRSYPVHLKVCSYNVGMYSNGISTDTPAADALENLSGFLGANNFDILGIQEGRINVNGTNADETVYNDYFISQKSLLNNCAIKSQFVLKDTGEGTFTAGSRKYVYATAIIGNKEVFIINVHLALTATDRASNYTELLALLKAHEYFIAFGDFNAAIDYNTGVEEQTQAEYNNLINAGYTVANGGRWGLLTTIGTQTKYPDNICVSGNIKIITSKTADVYATMNSDHIPIIAELVV